MSKGAFGFTLNEQKHSDYVAEKLGIGINETSEKFAELLNGIINEIRRKNNE